MPVPCILRVNDRNYDCHVIDISMSGACIATQYDAFELRVDMVCDITFGVLNVRAHGRITRIHKIGESYEFGIGFDGENQTILNKVLHYRLTKSDAFKQSAK